MTKDEDWNVGAAFVKWTLPIVLVSIVALGFVARGAGWFSEKTFAPLEEQVRHDTFKQSQAYRDGMAQDLNAMWLEYTNFKTSKEQRAAIRAVVLHRTSSFDGSTLPPHLQKWIRELRSSQP